MSALSIDTAQPASSSRVWPELPMELADRIVSHIHPNHVACNVRLISKAAALRFRGPQHTTIRLSQPVPPDAFARHWLAPGATRGFTLLQRRKLLCLTAASGSIPNLEVAVRAAGYLPTQVVFGEAAAAGSLDTCQWLHQQRDLMGFEGPLGGGDVLSAAAGGGHMHVCDWLMTLNVYWVWGAEKAAAEGGHVALMEYLMQRRSQLRYLWSPGKTNRMQLLATAAAKGCDLPTLQRLWPSWGKLHQDDSFKAEVLAAAAGSPTPDWAAKVEWLEGQGCPRTKAAATKAAARPDALQRLTWLRGRGYRLGRAAVYAAAENGNTAALQYLLGEGVRPKPQDDDAVTYAAKGGHLPALQALHAAGWLVDARRAVEEATAAGHLHVVAWLVETLGAELDAKLFAAAAESGSMQLMTWLRQRGCGWDAAAFKAAAWSGCEEALEWLVAQGCPVPEDSNQLYSTACQRGDLATVRCMRQLGLPWGDPRKLLSDAVKFARPPMLRWLLEAGCPVDINVAEAAAAALITESRLGWFGNVQQAEVQAAEVQAAEALGLIRQHLQQQQGHRQRHETL